MRLLFFLLVLLVLHSNLFELFLNPEALLGSGDDAPLRSQLTVLMIEDHPHRVFEVFKLLWIDHLHLLVGELVLFDEWEQNIGRERLAPQVQLLRDLTLLEAFINPPDVLTQRAIIIILDAIVAAAIQEFGDISPLVAVDLVRIEDNLLFDVVDR